MLMNVFLWIAAIALAAVNMGVELLTATGPIDKWMLFVGVVAYGVLGPALIASLFCLKKAKRSWRRFLVAFSVISLMVAIPGVGKVAQGLSQPPKVVRGTGVPIQIAVPSDWKQSAAKSEAQSIHVTDRLGVTSVVGFSESKAEAGVPFATYVQQTVDGIKAKPTFQSMVPLQPCPISTLPCVSHEVHLVTGGSKVIAIMTVVEARAGYHILMAMTNEPLFEQARAKLTGILGSFKEDPAP